MINAIAAALKLARFLRTIQPELTAFGTYLYELYDGDREAAAAHIRLVRDYGKDLDAGRLRNDAELAELRSRKGRG
jgi:hypothetical protein